VCGTIEDTLSQVLREEVRLTVAGSTDAGVHATGQVAHTDLSAGLSAEVDFEQLLNRVGRALPADVRITGIRRVPAEFDARFTALRRHYRYRVCDARWGVNPLWRNHILAWPRPLDLDALNAAATYLLGLHDFVAFCRRREGATTIRELQRLEWTVDEPHYLSAWVSADAFCHSMVRSLVGALLAVGEGRKPVTWPAELLKATERPSAITVAPAHGLALIGVDYPQDDQLAARSAQTRAVRTKSE